jgi:hypothetical protein
MLAATRWSCGACCSGWQGAGCEGGVGGCHRWGVLGSAVGDLLGEAVLGAAEGCGGDMGEEVVEGLLLLQTVGGGSGGSFHAHHVAFAAARGWW